MAKETIGDCFMLSQKSVPCFLMVKVFDIPIHQLRFIASMFRVTHGAVFGFIPVESTVSGYPRGHLLMTGQAFLRNNFQVIIMTLTAVFKAR